MRAPLVLAALAGCLDPRPYECAADTDCTGGPGGICDQVSRVCSFLDPSCASGRRFGEYGGSLSNTCTEARALTNACVVGEPYPTPGDPCTSQVCARIPSCCEVSWGEACVRAADSLCDVHCARWIATTGTESHLLRWNAAAGDYDAVGALPGASGVIAWVDARDGGRPRLAQGRGRLVAVYEPGAQEPPLFADEAFRFDNGDGTVLRAVTAGDTNRDDSVEVSLLFGGTGPATVALVGGDGGIVATAPSGTLGGSEAIAWADYTHDGLLDFAVGMAAGYRLYYFSVAHGAYEDDYTKQLADQAFATMGWDDLDGDGRLDLVATGTYIAAHLDDDPAQFNGESTFSRRALEGSGLSGGALGDLDGDGRAELVSASTTIAKIGVYAWNITARRFDEPTRFDVGPLVQIALADVDDDGRLDVLGILDVGGLVWLRNTSTPGSFVLEPPQVIAAAGAATAFAATGWPAP